MILIFILIASILFCSCTPSVDKHVTRVVPTSSTRDAIYAGCVRSMARLTIGLDIAERFTMNAIYRYCEEIVRSFDEEAPPQRTNPT